MEQWFQFLHDELESVEQAWPQADSSKKVRLAEKLLELRQTSDRVVDLWLSFEEKLSRVIQRIKADEAQGGKHQSLSAPVPPADDEPDGGFIAPSLGESPGEAEEREESVHLFRRGEGFYHLRLFHDASKHFSELLQRSPDWEIGRLYYAYSLLFGDDKEGAIREFRLLSRSAASAKVTAICYNAIGCLSADEHQWLEAEQAFQAALAAMPDHPEAQFNLALCYLHAGQAKEAMEAIDRYLERAEDDWEAQLVWLRSAKRLAELTQRSPLEIPVNSRAFSRQRLDPQTLREMAALYEADGFVHRAQHCYRIVTEELPRAGWGWHGLAWNTWLIAGSKEAMPLMKKAVSLAPESDDFLFSYGWMELFDGEIERAFDAFRFVLARSPEHRLAQSGLVAAYERAGDFEQAKRLARAFADSDDPYLASLGHYHLGRLAVAEADWQRAERHFLRVRQSGDQFREVPLYLQLCANKLGKEGVSSSFALLPY